MKDQNQKITYAYPRLSKADLLFIRIGGNGLGNLLFTWARCLAASQRHGWRIIWPTWGSVKPKNWRVNPYDHRTYLDLFQPNKRYVTGWRKPWCLANRPWISEAQADVSPVSPGSVVEFRGMEDYFKPFLQDHALVYGELMRITQPQHLVACNEPSPVPIAIHVRRGDFSHRSSYDEIVSLRNSLLPLDWYIQALTSVRKKAGSDVPAFVFSDGTDAELEALTTMPGVRRVDYGSSLADMLGLSSSRLLIASGSTFSMWGSYLGQVPTIWHPGNMLQPLLLTKPEQQFEWEPGISMPDWVGMLSFPNRKGLT